MMKFILHFNHRRQYIDIQVWKSARRFYNKFGDCIGIYWGDTNRQPRKGKFGELHLIQSYVDAELVSHELLHFLIDLVRVRNGHITKRNEEAIVSEYGAMVKQFWKKYSKEMKKDGQ